MIHDPTPISKEVENPYDSARYGIYGHKMIYEGYRIEVSYPFSGDAILFNVCPNSFTIGGAYAEIKVNELDNTLSLIFEVWDQNAEQFTHNKQSAFEHQLSIKSVHPNQMWEAENMKHIHQCLMRCMRTLLLKYTNVGNL